MQIELPDELVAEAAAVAQRSGQSAETLIAETLLESLKMRKVPGVVFADGATGRRARIAGTGIEVFEVVDAYELFERDIERLEGDLPQLSREQIQAALSFYETYPEDILPRLRSDEQVSAELQELRQRNPRIGSSARTASHPAVRLQFPE